MDKKVKGSILLVLGLFLMYLLIDSRRILYSETSEGGIRFIFLNFFTLFFGRMSWFISLIFMIAGLLLIIKKNIKIDKMKVLAIVVAFLATSVLFIKNSITKPLPNSFTDAGRVLLELGFNGKSGGLPGGLLSMPLYKIIDTVFIGIFLFLVVVACLVYVLRFPFEYTYEFLKGLWKYYTSEEYKEKAKLLKDKKMSEKLKKTDYQKYKKEEMKKKIKESRNQKLSFELSKKPKNNFLDKTEMYTKKELSKKKKEWAEFSENMKERNIFAEDRKPEEKIVEKEKTVKKKEPVKAAQAEMKEEKRPKPLEISLDETGKAEKKQEEVKKEFKEITEIPKIEAFEDTEALEREKMLEESIKNTEDALLNSKAGYNELLKKSIEEIFKVKPMNLEKKFEIEKSIIENVNHLENVLKQFGIDAKVVNYEYGPTITRYEITIPAGIKVSRVTSLSDDIALNLAAESIRIEAPIPGKNTIGIETPNKIKEAVHFSNIIKNEELEKGELNVILGKDIVGRDKIIDIAKMPHLLIAGQTGSGKSVAVNTLISTLISKKSEKEVRFIMIDPKMVELMPYNDIPHLLIPVIINPHDAAIALRWAVNEMENRYKQLMENGVRNIKGYNSLKYVEKMPYIVIIIDELADLMMAASGSVEESIARIAQKARAVGIHLVVATQRPSTDVITGMIKANLPSRISFALRTQIDSRTILDSAGAEKLLGQGDMLLLENGSSKLERIQGAFISDEEVINLTSTLKANRKVKYQNEILSETVENKENLDPFFNNAIEVIRQGKKVSISLLQRELHIGFNRASRIYEQLKEKGIISYDNQILIDDDLENEIKNK